MVLPNLTLIYDRKGQSSATKTGIIEIKVQQNKVRKYISTGIKVLPKEWHQGSIVGRRDWRELNTQLHALTDKCQEIIGQMASEGSIEIGAIGQILKESMVQKQTFIEYAKDIAQVRLRKVRPGTREHYELFFRFMESWKGIKYFCDVTPKNVQKMDDFLADKGLKEVSRWSYHKMLKFFIIRAMKEGLLKADPYDKLDIKKGNESGLTRFLTPAEFHRFESCTIPVKSLDRVRDLFVFQTYTMMSYADMAKFDYRKCESVNGQMVYKAKRVKTGQEFVVVLLRPALVILQKYNGKLPIISNIKYNAYLKSAVLYAQIDKAVTTHWARHTGATMLLNEGNLPMHIVQHILGHASIRETEKTYAKVLDRTIIEQMANYGTKNPANVLTNIGRG